jgi:hypothetical protein
LPGLRVTTSCDQPSGKKDFHCNPSRGTDSGFAVYASFGDRLRQGPSGLSELLCLSRRANKERAARARPGAQKIMALSHESIALASIFQNTLLDFFTSLFRHFL